MKKEYVKYRSKGFEVVGISLDEDRDALDRPGCLITIMTEAEAWPMAVAA